jgi:diacylglycerol kinase family enzyme
MSTQVRQPPVPGPARRLAALVALAAPVVAVLAGLEITFQHPGNLTVLVVSVAVATVAAWYALTRRGILRAGAGAMAVAAVVVVVLAGLSVLLLQLALLVLFAVAGRYALGPDAAGLVLGGHARTVAAARHGVLLINPRSGDGAAIRLNLAAVAVERNLRVISLEPGDDLAELAERAAADGADVLGMAGGDGSQAIVAGVAVRHGIAFACVPSGTRNHFALDLGLNRGDVLQALEAFTDAVERTVDLGLVNDRVFVNNASLGVYAEVVRSGAYRGAKLRTFGRMLPDLLGPGAAPSDLEFEGPGERRYTGMSVVLVSNNPYRLSRMGRAGGRPRLDSGRLGILAARVSGGVADKADHPLRRFADVREWSRPDFEVRSAAAIPVGVDGEALMLTPPLRFTSLPGVLRVRLPRHGRAAQLARRNAALTRADLTALVRIVAGRPAVAAVPAVGAPRVSPPG